ncbi:hypothetical protein NDU88_004891 [Pleurodeles waltl]|uniref:Uncharacterized protein n=1 Tax=Pleurodeles waltl TaxID=8319 RepID=A0AAV7L2N1_PLEWA|nr:hypothetical protein NDU88_004891 [Pleurodeles waltl]
MPPKRTSSYDTAAASAPPTKLQCEADRTSHLLRSTAQCLLPHCNTWMVLLCVGSHPLVATEEKTRSPHVCRCNYQKQKENAKERELEAFDRTGSTTTELARQARRGEAAAGLRESGPGRGGAEPFFPGIAALPHASEVHQNTPNGQQEEDTDTRPNALKRLRENERELFRNEPRTLIGSGKEGVWCCYGREGDGPRS